MNKYYSCLSAAALAMFLCSCATDTTKVKSTWKSPDFNGAPVQKVAVIAIADQGLVRTGFENRLVRQLKQQGQDAFTTVEMLSLSEIKADKEAAAARLRQAGADSVLIVRVVGRSAYDTQVRSGSAMYTPVIIGYGSTGWYDYYSIAFVDLGVVHGNIHDTLVLDSSLFDLNATRRIWSGNTLTSWKDDSDKLVVADEFVATVVAAMHNDGVIR